MNWLLIKNSKQNNKNTQNKQTKTKTNYKAILNSPKPKIYEIYKSKF